MEKPTNGAWVELDEGLAETTESAEELAAVAALNPANESAAVIVAEENRKPTDLTSNQVGCQQRISWLFK